jgi:L-fuculose-phosphate aldolase
MAYNKPTSRVSDWKLKEQFCDIGRRIWVRGFCAGNEGNHSYRLGEDRVLCTPTGISKGNLKPDDLCIVDMNGKQVGGSRKRTSEILLHLTIYKLRPDVKAVIHSHPPHATAFAVAGVDLPSCIHPEAEVFLGPVHTAKYVTPGDQRLGESIAPFVKDSNTIVMGNHGVVCYGTDLEDAYYKLEIVDAYSRILILAKQVGSIRQLSADEMKELVALKARFGLSDPRVAADGQVKNISCSADFLTRVSDVATRGRMACDGGTAPVPTSLERAISSLAPQKFGDDDIEQLVQSITDQIMATV